MRSRSGAPLLRLQVVNGLDDVCYCSTLATGFLNFNIFNRSAPLQEDEPEALWDIVQPPLFGESGVREADLSKGARMMSFDAIMSAPQGRPVAVRMQRDSAVKKEAQPLVNFFRNALGLSSRSARCALCRAYKGCAACGAQHALVHTCIDMRHGAQAFWSVRSRLSCCFSCLAPEMSCAR